LSIRPRIKIIKHNYEYLNKEGYLNEMEQIDDDIFPILNSHLNSIYIHISGGLDNLAWAFCYWSNVFGEIDESNYEFRRKVGLRNQRFIIAIGKYKNLCSFLKESEEWLQELKEFRDPIAHREILLVSRIYNPEEAKRKDELENKIKLLVESTTIKVISKEIGVTEIEAIDHKVEKIQDEIDLIGKYYPVFCTTPEPKSVLSIKNQIEKDIMNFIHIADKIIDTIEQKEKE